MPVPHYEPKIIDRLGDRLSWLAQNTPYDPSLNLNSSADIIRTMMYSSGKSKASYYGWFGGSFPTPYQIIKAILDIFPCVTIEALTASTYEDFLEHMEAYEPERKRWSDIVDHIATNRALLEQAGKAYHRDVDEAPPGFPLITAAGWLLKEPQRLTRDDAYDLLLREIRDVEGPTLFKGRGNYIHVKLRQMKSKKWYNGPTFRVHSITPDKDSLSFKFSPGSYFNYVNTCELRAAELAEACMQGLDLTPSTLKLRGEPADIFDFSNRSAPPGVNCVLFLKGYKRNDAAPMDEFVMHLRSTETLEAQNTNHVVPAGGHSPLSEHFKGDWEQRIWNTAARELLEELFDKEEAGEIHESGDGFFNSMKIKPLVDAFFGKKGCAAIYLLGVGLDPLTTKPEILVAIVLDWKKASYKLFNKELKIKRNYEGHIRYCDLSEKRLAVEALHPLNGRPVLPAGAACLLLASKHFDKLYGSV